MAVTSRKLDPGKDGLPGWIAHPNAPGPHPGVLMLHHAPGLTGDYRTNATLLAQLGFTVLVPNLFNMLGVPGDFHMGQGGEIQARNDDQAFFAVIDRACRALAGRPDTDPRRIGVLGHCMGGRLGIPYAADNAEIAALVLFYATIRDEPVSPARPRHSFETAKRVRCPTLVFYGGEDYLTTNKTQLTLFQSFLESGAPFEWHYWREGRHGMANPDSDGYQPFIGQLTWSLTTEFLQRVLADPR